MNIKTLIKGFILFFLITAGWTASAEDQTKSPAKLLRLVCQSYNEFEYEFLDRVIILQQLSTTPMDKYPYSDSIDGSYLIDPLRGHDPHFRLTDSAQFRMRIYRTSLISENRTEEEVIEELLKRPGDLRVAKHFEDPAPMDYVGEGYRMNSVFHFKYRREEDGFAKSFEFPLNEFYGRKVFSGIGNFRDLSVDTLKEFDRKNIFIMYPNMWTNGASITLLEDGSYICKKPILTEEI